MQNFGNHMENRDITQIRYNIQDQNAKTSQRTERIRHIHTKFQSQDLTRHKQLRGSHKVLTIFFHASQASKECTQ